MSAVEQTGRIRGEDGRERCWWPGSVPLYLAYHDGEWGRPVADDRRLFEKICLEGFQAGLSWITILKKREHFREVFHNFDFAEVARMDEGDVERLMQDKRIVRHRGKIRSVINNGKRALELVEREGSLAAWFWAQEPSPDERPQHLDYRTAMTLGKTERSTAISRELKKRGWTFVGPTTVYAFMQAMGLVNDHLEGCCMRAECERQRTDFRRPQAG